MSLFGQILDHLRPQAAGGSRQQMLCQACGATFNISPDWRSLPSHKFHNGEFCHASGTTNFRFIKVPNRPPPPTAPR